MKTILKLVLVLLATSIMSMTLLISNAYAGHGQGHGAPPGWSHGKKVGWHGGSVPPGWHHHYHHHHHHHHHKY